MEENALERAKLITGGPAALAKAIGGISSQAVSQWRRVPAERVIDVERITGIPRHELRPDLARIFVAPTDRSKSVEEA